MNALKARKRYDEEQARLARERIQAEEELKLASMTDEEREEYLKKQEQIRGLANRLFRQSLGGPYSSDKTVKLINDLNKCGF